MTARSVGRDAILLFAGLALGVFAFRGENFLERIFIDLRFSILSASHVPPRSCEQIAIIRLDRRSEAILGVPYGTRWRQFYPAFIRTLKNMSATIVVFDSMFLDQEPRWDGALAAAIGEAGNVIAGEDGSRRTPPLLRESFISIGSLSITPLGGKPRYVAIAPVAASTLRPLSMVAVEEYGKRAGFTVPNAVDRHRSGFWINYSEPPDYFPSFSFIDILNADGGRLADAARTPQSILQNRLVFVGLDDPSSRSDRFLFPNTFGQELPGVYGHAYAADSILNARLVTRATPVGDAGITVLFLLALLAVLKIRGRPARTLLVSFLPVGAFVAQLVILSRIDLWLGYAPLFTSFWAVLALHWTLSRFSLAASLSKAVGFDPRLIDAFRRESARNGGHVRKEVALLIADIRDYTRYVSRADPVVVSRVMAEYMHAMERCITGQGGYINKYVGDEIVAVFGFPLGADRCAERAVRSGITMLEDTARLVSGWKSANLPCFERIGIGIDTGSVVFAEVGGPTKSQFDIIGDCINGASRIEHLTKEFERGLLISEETNRTLESVDSLAGAFELVETVLVRGQGERRVFGLVRES